MYKLIAALILVFATTEVFADVAGATDVSSDLGSFFTSLGYEGNITPGTAYQGQAAGYYSGGNMFLRDRVRNIQLINIDPPKFRNGCGGIDLFGGGFSFVNEQALTDFFQKIMSNAGGYMFDLALETAVPELSHAMEYIQNLAQEINANNFNSCEIAETFIGGMWPRTKATHDHICRDLGSYSGKFADWAEARQKCKDETKYNEVMNKAEEAGHGQSILINKNLIWDALNAKDYIKDDYVLKEFFMSLSGTIIYGSSVGKVKIYTPLAKDRRLLKALLEGGKAEIYKCDANEYTKCLTLTPTETIITKNNSLYEKVKKTINRLVTAVANDSGPLDKDLQGFLEMVKFPLLRFITTHLMANQAAMAMSIANYSEAISKSLLMQYMHESLQVVEHSLSNTDYAPEVHKQLIDQIHSAMSYVEAIKTESRSDIQELMKFIESSKSTEQEVTSKVVGQLKHRLGGGS
ncbi:conjugative transfer pilus assembly protein TraH [Gammaproteobacteria bacterium]